MKTWDAVKFNSLMLKIVASGYPTFRAAVSPPVCMCTMIFDEKGRLDARPTKKRYFTTLCPCVSLVVFTSSRPKTYTSTRPESAQNQRQRTDREKKVRASLVFCLFSIFYFVLIPVFYLYKSLSITVEFLMEYGSF